MTSKSGFFVFILIASGCLSKACGDGEISTSPRSFEAAPTPNQSDVEEPASKLRGAPYVHVTPADMGVTIGPGVVAPYPTEAWTGGCVLAQDDLTIENKVVTCEKLRLDGDNITIRNSVLNISNGISVGENVSSNQNFLIEYSDIYASRTDAKVFNIWRGGCQTGDFRNLTIRNSHIHGGFDLFDMNGNLDGALIENNWLGPVESQDPVEHADGFQVGSHCVNATGTITLRGNYADAEEGGDCDKYWCVGKTAFWFGAYGTMNAIIESNRLPNWGGTTLWASDDSGPDTMQVRYNLYSPKWELGIGDRCYPYGGNPDCIPWVECCSYPAAAASWCPSCAPLGSARCNRYESDGRFVEDEHFDGVTHDTDGCPSYPP